MNAFRRPLSGQNSLVAAFRDRGSQPLKTWPMFATASTASRTKANGCSTRFPEPSPGATMVSTSVMSGECNHESGFSCFVTNETGNSGRMQTSEGVTAVNSKDGPNTDRYPVHFFLFLNTAQLSKYWLMLFLIVFLLLHLLPLLLSFLSIPLFLSHAPQLLLL